MGFSRLTSKTSKNHQPLEAFGQPVASQKHPLNKHSLFDGSIARPHTLWECRSEENMLYRCPQLDGLGLELAQALRIVEEVKVLGPTIEQQRAAVTRVLEMERDVSRHRKECVQCSDRLLKRAG
jgi:hypothetical protein